MVLWGQGCPVPRGHLAKVSRTDWGPGGRTGCLGAGTALHIPPPMREKEHESGCGKSSSGPAQPAAQLWDLSGHSPSLASASNQSNYGLPGGSLAPRTGRLLISPNPTRRYKPRPCRGANCSRLLTISGSQVGTVRSRACHLQRWR